MGYTTEFNGQFDLDKPLTDAQAEYLKKFAETRRMQRDSAKAELMEDPLRIAVGLPIGVEGEYFVGGLGCAGQDNDASVIEGNSPSSTQPGLWCQWTVTSENDAIKWDGGEKFYDYTEWLKYIIEHLLIPWGYVLNGEVEYRGEDWSDTGFITVNDNVVTSN